MEAFRLVYTREENQRPTCTSQTYSRRRLTTRSMVTTLPFRRLWPRSSIWRGRPSKGRNLARFPTMQAARDWYDSPAYQTIAAQRFAGSRHRAFIIEGRR